MKTKIMHMLNAARAGYPVTVIINGEYYDFDILEEYNAAIENLIESAVYYLRENNPITKQMFFDNLIGEIDSKSEIFGVRIKRTEILERAKINITKGG